MSQLKVQLFIMKEEKLVKEYNTSLDFKGIQERDEYLA